MQGIDDKYDRESIIFLFGRLRIPSNGGGCATIPINYIDSTYSMCKLISPILGKA